MKFYELDTVKVVNNKIRKNMIGIIVYVKEYYSVYEVEFLDSEGYTIDLQTIRKDDLELIKAYRYSEE